MPSPSQNDRVESHTVPQIGAQVDLTLRCLFDGQDIALACQGEVIGVECHGNGYQVAVRLRQPLFTEEDLACLGGDAPHSTP